MKKNILVLLMLASAVNVMGASQDTPDPKSTSKNNGIFAYLSTLRNEFRQNYVYNGPKTVNLLNEMVTEKSIEGLIGKDSDLEDYISKNIVTVIDAEYFKKPKAIDHAKNITTNGTGEYAIASFNVSGEEAENNKILSPFVKVPVGHVSKISPQAERDALLRRHTLTALKFGSVLGGITLGGLVAKETGKHLWNHGKQALGTALKQTILTSDTAKTIGIVAGAATVAMYIGLEVWKRSTKNSFLNKAAQEASSVNPQQ